jgi:preprotein translocase subunit SecD
MKCLALAAVGLALVVGGVATACGGDGPLEGPRVRLVLEPDVAESPDVDVADALNAAADIIERRVDAFGSSEAIVRHEDQNRLSVEVTNLTPAEATRLIATTGFFEFRQPKLDQDDNMHLCKEGTVTYDPPGCEGGEEVAVSPESVTIEMQQSVIWVQARATGTDGLEKDLTGRFLKANTYVEPHPIMGTPLVNFEMTSEGSSLLEQVTGRLVGLPMAFFLDGEPIRGEDNSIIAPVVRAVISDQGIIEGLQADDANLLSSQLNAGALPVPLKVVSVEELSE